MLFHQFVAVNIFVDKSIQVIEVYHSTWYNNWKLLYLGQFLSMAIVQSDQNQILDPLLFKKKHGVDQRSDLNQIGPLYLYLMITLTIEILNPT